MAGFDFLVKARSDALVVAGSDRPSPQQKNACQNSLTGVFMSG